MFLLLFILHNHNGRQFSRVNFGCQYTLAITAQLYGALFYLPFENFLKLSGNGLPLCTFLPIIVSATDRLLTLHTLMFTDLSCRSRDVLIYLSIHLLT